MYIQPRSGRGPPPGPLSPRDHNPYLGHSQISAQCWKAAGRGPTGPSRRAFEPCRTGWPAGKGWAKGPLAAHETRFMTQKHRDQYRCTSKPLYRPDNPCNSERVSGPLLLWDQGGGTPKPLKHGFRHFAARPYHIQARAAGPIEACKTAWPISIGANTAVPPILYCPLVHG